MDRQLLSRYLRQQKELGGGELYLDRIAPADVAALLAGRGPLVSARPAPVVRERPQPPDAAAATGSRGRAAGSSGATSSENRRSGADAAARQLTVLAADASGCTRCRLHETRTSVVFGEGNPQADVVVVGEAPGQEEDRTGRPFVGRAGRLLDLLLMAVGLPRDDVYICNVLKCRPPQNRNPFADEVEPCTTNFLHGQLEAITPRVLLAVGKFAAQALCQSEEAIGRLRGRVHAYHGTPLVVTYHPAYLLRSPNMVRVAWQDLQVLRKVLDGQA